MVSKQAAQAANTTAPTKSRRQPGEVTINIALPADLHRQLRIRAIREELTLKEAIAAAVEVWTS